MTLIDAYHNVNHYMADRDSVNNSDMKTIFHLCPSRNGIKRLVKIINIHTKKKREQKIVTY